MDSCISCRLIAFISFIITLSGITVDASSSVQNGNFSNGLNGWTVEWGYVVNPSDYALFAEHPIDISSTLSQEFTIPSLAQVLSFEILMSETPGEDSDTSEWPDAFTASLLDPITNNPLIANDGYTDFFYIDNSGVIDTVADFTGRKVSLDVSGFAGCDAYLVFDLWMSYDGKQTIAQLDNVEISVIPAPGALLLGLIGISSLRVLKKS